LHADPARRLTSQRPRFGTYQLWEKGRLQEKGLFYDKVSPVERDMLTAGAPKHGCVEPRSISNFIHEIFLPVAFKAGLIVGFNGPDRPLDCVGVDLDPPVARWQRAARYTAAPGARFFRIAARRSL
jgi:hypothetical protein